MYVYNWITCYIPENNMTLYINSTSIKLKKFKVEFTHHKIYKVYSSVLLSIPTELCNLTSISLNSRTFLSPQKDTLWGFPGGSVVKSLPASAGDTDSIPDLKRSHMPQSS